MLGQKMDKGWRLDEYICIGQRQKQPCRIRAALLINKVRGCQAHLGFLTV